MRFHMGISFRLKTLKKFIIPFLIGLISYFGLKIVNAQSIYEDSYFYALDNSTYDVESLLKSSYFGNISGLDVVESFKNFDTSDYGYAIFLQLNNTNSALLNIQVLLFGNTYNLSASAYTTDHSSLSMYFTSSSTSTYGRLFSISPYFNIQQSFFDSNFYFMMVSCFSNFSSCPSSKPSETIYSGSLTLQKRQYTTSVSSNYIDYSEPNSNIYINNNFIYYDSTKDFTYSVPNSSSDVYYRDLKVNSDFVNIGDIFPTYLSQQSSLEPDSPDEDIVELKGLSKYVFWFFSPESRNDLLINIYVIVFLSLLGLIILKFFTYIHNVSWKR